MTFINPLFALFLLRVVLGVVFIVHGYPKLFKNFSQFSGWLGSMGFRPARFWAIVAGSVEFFGGIGLVLGVFTQPVGFLIAFQMVVAMVKVKWGKASFTGENGWELDLIYVFVALAIALSGPGMYAF